MTQLDAEQHVYMKAIMKELGAETPQEALDKVRALKERSLRFYRADGSYSLAETEEVAINARIAAAIELAALKEVVEKVRKCATDMTVNPLPLVKMCGRDILYCITEYRSAKRHLDEVAAEYRKLAAVGITL